MPQPGTFDALVVRDATENSLKPVCTTACRNKNFAAVQYIPRNNVKRHYNIE